MCLISRESLADSDNICPQLSEMSATTTMLEESSVHIDHCAACYLMTCDHPVCRVVDCSNGCGTRYHLCKEEDHLEEVCSEQEVPCINAGYGCQDTMLRL